MSEITNVSNKFPSMNELDQLFNFIKEISEEDSIFKSALDRVIKGEEHENVVADLLFGGDMKEVINANLADNDNEGGLLEAMNDIKVLNETKFLQERINQLELDDHESSNSNVIRNESVKKQESDDESVDE